MVAGTAPSRDVSRIDTCQSRVSFNASESNAPRALQNSVIVDLICRESASPLEAVLTCATLDCPRQSTNTESPQEALSEVFASYASLYFHSIDHESLPEHIKRPFAIHDNHDPLRIPLKEFFEALTVKQPGNTKNKGLGIRYDRSFGNAYCSRVPQLTDVTSTPTNIFPSRPSLSAPSPH